ncbi:MAG: iron chaperone [Actinomycetota bacterium]
MAQDVEAYLEGVTEAQRTALEKLRRIITDVVPDATETIRYGMPTFKYHGKTVAHFAAFKNHCSLFPASGTVFEKLEGELKSFRTSKGTVQFTPDNELPESLVRKILQVRISEIDGNR